MSHLQWAGTLLTREHLKQGRLIKTKPQSKERAFGMRVQVSKCWATCKWMTLYKQPDASSFFTSDMECAR
jgi:hypothetical protein